jgi:hypothetical protein
MPFAEMPVRLQATIEDNNLEDTLTTPTLTFNPKSELTGDLQTSAKPTAALTAKQMDFLRTFPNKMIQPQSNKLDIFSLDLPQVSSLGSELSVARCPINSALPPPIEDNDESSDASSESLVELSDAYNPSDDEAPSHAQLQHSNVENGSSLAQGWQVILPRTIDGPRYEELVNSFDEWLQTDSTVLVVQFLKDLKRKVRILQSDQHSHSILTNRNQSLTGKRCIIKTGIFS